MFLGSSVEEAVEIGVYERPKIIGVRIQSELNGTVMLTLAREEGATKVTLLCKYLINEIVLERLNGQRPADIYDKGLERLLQNLKTLRTEWITLVSAQIIGSEVFPPVQLSAMLSMLANADDQCRLKI